MTVMEKIKDLLPHTKFGRRHVFVLMDKLGYAWTDQKKSDTWRKWRQAGLDAGIIEPHPEMPSRYMRYK